MQLKNSLCLGPMVNYIRWRLNSILKPHVKDINFQYKYIYDSNIELLMKLHVQICEIKILRQNIDIYLKNSGENVSYTVLILVLINLEYPQVIQIIHLIINLYLI